MTGAHCESEDKENASQNVQLANATKKCEQKDDSENEKLRSKNEKLRQENERLRKRAAEAERAAASAKSQWLSTGNEYIGKRVRRFFPDHPSADGVVKKWRPPTEDEDGTVQFHVEHDDSDEEDLDEAEVKAGIKAYTLGPSDLGLPRLSHYGAVPVRNLRASQRWHEAASMYGHALLPQLDGRGCHGTRGRVRAAVQRAARSPPRAAPSGLL